MRRSPEIYWGDSLVRQGGDCGAEALISRDGKKYYRIENFHRIPPFLMTVVSGYDHWIYLSSSGGLTCGRGNPDQALFPYYTDDKIHDAHSTTGPETVLLVNDGAKIHLWRPFSPGVEVYEIERMLYRNQAGTKLVFEEVNNDLGLVFSYSWSSSDRFGFVRKARLGNISSGVVQVEVLDGLRNVLPYGVSSSLQTSMSTLLDAYKQAEAVEGLSAGIFTLSSILTDRAEPSEALKATFVWSRGLDEPRILLSENQVEAFCSGRPVGAETFKKGQRGAFYVQSGFELPSAAEKSWHILADINLGPSKLAGLLKLIRRGVSADVVEREVEAGRSRLLQLVGSADGCQMSADERVAGRHFSNTLFNIMRGGTFYDGYRFPVRDFLDFVAVWNRPLEEKFASLLGSDNDLLTRDSVIACAQSSGDADMERLALEYLPLKFSRRHGDPSRPWNSFSIEIRKADGSDRLNFQGNWRDIFQNWEALAISHPEYIESFVAKFVNASTADGYNPYRLTRDGFEWEVLDPDEPWSNIGYWGDHQVNYLVKLLELSNRYHPGKIGTFLARDIFVYANVPYQIKNYEALINNPRNSVEYDDAKAEDIARAIEEIGSDGKLLRLSDGSIYRVSLLEKLLVPVLSKIASFVPGGGIWMNTQRPEWNDANNALVGYGLSMVTLCYLRRFLVLFAGLLDKDDADRFAVSEEVLRLFTGIEAVLKNYIEMLGTGFGDQGRYAFMEELGKLAEFYRASVYQGFSGRKAGLDKASLLSFIETSLGCLDDSISRNRRPDGLFHSYNLIHFGHHGHSIENLDEMLEGQVAVLSSGFLEPRESLALLEALRVSRIYRSDQNSYMLYPYKKLKGFLEKNVIEQSVVEENAWMKNELKSRREDFIEQDTDGCVHFNGRFRNAAELGDALEKETQISPEDSELLCNIFEATFNHRQFMGRSGAMYKYEGLGSIYWHMVSKLLLATQEVISLSGEAGANVELTDRLIARFDEIKEGLGLHKTPAEYGAFTVDPYSHTPAFTGVQQPGMTGQVKEDVIIRFAELGVSVNDGKITFIPSLLKREEFSSVPVTWRYSVGGEEQSLELEADSLAFCLCGVPVIYRLSDFGSIKLSTAGHGPEIIHGETLDRDWSQSLFRREGLIRKILVDVAEE